MDQKAKNISPGGNTSHGKSIILGLIILGFIWLSSGVYKVMPEQQGVVLRFGKFIRTSQPGLNYHFPFPIEKVLVPKVTKMKRIEIGFRSLKNNISAVPEESLMLTQDENIVDINFSIFWVIKDSGKFLFNIKDPEKTVKGVSESVMRQAIGNQPLKSILADPRVTIENRTLKEIQSILDEYNSGIQIMQIHIEKADLPAKIHDAHKKLQTAKEELDKSLDEADAFRNDIIPKARGQAQRIIDEANAQHRKIILQAEAKATQFNQILTEYKKAPDITRRRLYLETMEKVLGNSSKIVLRQDYPYSKLENKIEAN